MLTDDDRQEIERRALGIASYLDWRDGPYRAEVVEGCEPHWYLVQTMPNDEFKAAEFLADRQFGVFVPKFAPDVKMTVKGEDLCGSRRLIFLCHILVFAWDVKIHWRRVHTCPAVVRVLLDRDEHPVIVPDYDIDYIYSLQFGWKKPKRDRHPSKRQQPRTEAEIQSTLAGLENLTPDERNARLHSYLRIVARTSA